MITNEKYLTKVGSFRSRFYSPVFRIPPSYTKDNQYLNYCFRFKYNIYGNNNNKDGFYVKIENYQNANESELLYSKYAPLSENKWYSANVLIKRFRYIQSRVNKYLKEIDF